VGEAGPVEQSSAEAKSLKLLLLFKLFIEVFSVYIHGFKLRAKRLPGCHPSGQQPRPPDGGPEGQIKNYSHNNVLKETELKAALNWKH
jgi:hypothetical protein